MSMIIGLKYMFGGGGYDDLKIKPININRLKVPRY